MRNPLVNANRVDMVVDGIKAQMDFGPLRKAAHFLFSPSLGRGLTSDRGDQSGEVRKVIYSPKAVVFARLEESHVVGARNVSQVSSVR